LGHLGTLMRLGGVLVFYRDLSGQKRKLGQEKVKFWMLYQPLTTILQAMVKKAVESGKAECHPNDKNTLSITG